MEEVKGFDFETYLMAPGLLAPPPVCLSTSDHDLYHACLHPDDTAQKLWKLYSGEVVGANVAFDSAVAIARWPELTRHVFGAYDEGRVHDVQLNQKLIDNAKGNLGGWVGKTKITYSLAALELRLLGYDRSADKGPDSWRMRYEELASVPIEDWPQAAYDYAIADAVGALEVLRYQIENYGELFASDAQAQARSAFILHVEECRGIHTDPLAIEDLKREALARFNEVTRNLVQAKLVRGKDVPKKEGTRDTKAARRRMVEKCKEAGIPVKLTDTGRKKHKDKAEFVEPDHPLAIEYPSCDKEACARVGDDVLEEYAERVSLVTLIRTDIPDLERGSGDVPIQPSYNTILATGRTSARKHRIAYGAQIQNRARDSGVRECFRARDGTLLVAADAGGLELAAWAQACLDLVGMSTLADDLVKGRDAHLVVAAELLGISYEEASKHKHEKRIKDARNMAKVINFGFQGGMGAGTFVTYARMRGFKINRSKAEEMRDAWRRVRPEHKPYFTLIGELVDDGGTITQLGSGRIRGGCRFTQAANGFFQGLGADASLRAHWYVTKAAYAEPESLLYQNLWPLLFVHDEIVSEVTAYESLAKATKPERQAVADMAYEKQRLMEAGYSEFIPDIPVRCDPALARWWSKATLDEPVYDSDGILIPLDVARLERVEAFAGDGRALT